MAKDTVCRVDERKHPSSTTAIEFINDVLNPLDRVEARFAEQDSKLNEINDKLTRLANNNNKTIAEGSQQTSFEDIGCKYRTLTKDREKF